MISQYNSTPENAYGVRNLINIVGKRIRFEGFIVGDPNFGPKYYAEHLKNVSQWIADGSIKAKMSVTKGIDNSIGGFIGMLQGKNFGKTILEISPLEG
jgi:NADPH-dependent curcumin reductase CurA